MAKHHGVTENPFRRYGRGALTSSVDSWPRDDGQQQSDAGERRRGTYANVTDGTTMTKPNSATTIERSQPPSGGASQPPGHGKDVPDLPLVILNRG